MNLYSVQQIGTSVATTATEIGRFFGIQMTIALIKMSQYTIYSAEFWCDHIASSIPLRDTDYWGAYFT